ncbi:MAG: hypothetical protein VR64_03190 [Desulfatitalea sp. BRH_c12]|nr:MAG: hypothetical protein VR64_03190 [Desulfatitalea sp. BRH_c12]
MELVFVCPVAHTPFKTDAYRIVENHGIRTDAAGQKHLDAKVCVDMACPHCGDRHIYSADALSCPFGND